jgi:hypothetical protein
MHLLSSVHLNYSNTYFSYNDVISSWKGDSIKLNPNYFLRKPGSKQQISLELFETILNFGFIYKQYYFNFNIEDKLDVAVNYPVNIIGLALQGNASQVGNNYDLSGLKVSGTYYREWAFGVSEIINKKLTLGAKAKLLFGKASVRTPENDAFLYTSNPKYYLTAAAAFKVNASPLDITISDHGRISSVGLPDGTSAASFLLNSKNKGAAFDVGAIYRYDDKIILSGSLLDVGFIYWKTTPVQVNATSTFDFKGIVFNPVTNSFDKINETRNSFHDSLKVTKAQDPYFTGVSPKLYLAGTYDLYPNVNAGLMLRNQLNYGKLLTSATASVNAQYKRYLAGSLSWSYINGSLLNFGAGVSVRTPTFGFYAISDNVYGAFKYKSARLINLRFGFNFLFGCSECGKDARKSIAAPGCAVYQEESAHNERLLRLKKKLKEQK